MARPITELLAEWESTVAPLKEEVVAAYDDAEVSGDYRRADELSADLKELQAEYGEAIVDTLMGR
jgi:hypothetical protein